MAAGPVVPAPEPFVLPPIPEEASWQGAYAGGALTWGSGSIDAKGDTAAALDAAGFDSTVAEPEGFGAALRGGYDWDLGRAVLGVGGTYDFMKPDDKTYVPSTLEISKLATLFARVGYDAGPWMPYALAGYSWAEVEETFPGTSETVDLDGYTVGLGLERRFNPRWSGFAEYTYTDFGDIDDVEGDLESDHHRVSIGARIMF